jgi:hypothetical protein
MQDLDHDPLEVQQYVPSPHKNEGMLPSRPSFAIGMIFLEKFGLHTGVYVH